MEEILTKRNLVTKSGEITVASLAANKLIGLYFTAHWCPPCRTFTPKLINIYNTVNTPTKILEIIFISFDRDSETMYNYLEEMPWAAVVYANFNLRESLGKQYGITGIPDLVVLKPDGSIVSDNGRSDVYAQNLQAVNFWLSKIENPNIQTIHLVQPEDEIEDSIIPRDPIEGLVCDMNHYLIWHGDVGKYYREAGLDPVIRCKYCKAAMKRSSWHCRECNFDLCLACRDWVVDSGKTNSQYLKCWEKHFLLLSDKLKEFYKKKFGTEKYSCRACNAQQDGNSFHCRRCFFDICSGCKEEIEHHSPIAERVKCQNGHGLVWTPDVCKIYKDKYKVHKYICNLCTKNYIGAGSFNCLECMFDICVSCIKKAITAPDVGIE